MHLYYIIAIVTDYYKLMKGRAIEGSEDRRKHTIYKHPR